MSTVKRFQCKRRGVAQGMSVAQDLRQLLRARTADLLYNALVVMVEDFPAEVPPGPNVVLDGVDVSAFDPWDYQVLSASTAVFTGIMTGQWFQLPVGFAVNQNRHRFEYNVYGPSFLVEEFEGLILTDKRVVDVGEIDCDDYGVFAEHLDGCWLGTLLDISTLHGMVARQADTMKSLKSYVKNEHYRSDAKLLTDMIGATNAMMTTGVEIINKLTEELN
jgi:hypothetical protein